jgi:hypothetical protein
MQNISAVAGDVGAGILRRTPATILLRVIQLTHVQRSEVQL